MADNITVKYSLKESVGDRLQQLYD